MGYGAALTRFQARAKKIGLTKITIPARNAAAGRNEVNIGLGATDWRAQN
jgi:hypothetical protein